MNTDDIKTINRMLAVRKDVYTSILPDNIQADSFINSVNLALHKTPSLVDPESRLSLFASIQSCARDGLIPNSVEAVFLKFGKSVVYMPMYRGMLKQMYEAGLRDIHANAVYENDDFVYELGDNPKLSHTPYIPKNSKDEQGGRVATYAIAHTKDGGVFRELIYEYEMIQIKQTTRYVNDIWNKYPDEMAKKTVIRRMAKRFPNLAGTRLQSVIQSEETALGFHVMQENITENNNKIDRLTKLIELNRKKEEEKIIIV